MNQSVAEQSGLEKELVDRDHIQSIPKSTLQKSTVDSKFVAALSATDFGPIAFKLMHPDDGKPWTLERATKAIEQYRRFLFLSKHYPRQRIVPSWEVDQVWHAHILDTTKYREDCDRLFGSFMDHWPYFGMKDEAEKAELDSAFLDTQQLMEAHFGRV